MKHLVEKGHQKEALSYVPRCDGPKRADLYVLCNDWRAAAKECKERGDKAKLECVIQYLVLSTIHADDGTVCTGNFGSRVRIR